MDGDTDPLACAQPAGIAFAPVGARSPIMQKVRVDVDKHSARILLNDRRNLGRNAGHREGFVQDVERAVDHIVIVREGYEVIS